MDKILPKLNQLTQGKTIKEIVTSPYHNSNELKYIASFGDADSYEADYIGDFDIVLDDGTALHITSSEWGQISIVKK